MGGDIVAERDKDEPFAFLRDAVMDGFQDARLQRRVAELAEDGEHGFQSPPPVMAQKAPDVFADDHLRLCLVYCPRVFIEKRSARIAEAEFLPRVAERLAREASRQHIGLAEVGTEIDIRHGSAYHVPVRAVRTQGGAGFLIELVEEDGFEARPLKPKRHPAGSREKLHQVIGPQRHRAFGGLGVSEKYVFGIQRAEILLRVNALVRILGAARDELAGFLPFPHDRFRDGQDIRHLRD